MKIHIRGIEARKFIKEGEKVPNITISNNSSILSIEKKNSHLEISFVFSCIYNPAIATIKIDGFAEYYGEDAEKIYKSWKSKKDLDIATIQNTIIQKSLMEAIILAKELDIVPPITFPKLQLEKIEKDNSYYG